MPVTEGFPTKQYSGCGAFPRHPSKSCHDVLSVAHGDPVRLPTPGLHHRREIIIQRQ
jgi:hypothetical protein